MTGTPSSPTVFRGRPSLSPGLAPNPESLAAWGVCCEDWTISWLTRLGVETCQSSLWEQRWLLSPRSQLVSAEVGAWETLKGKGRCGAGQHALPPGGEPGNRCGERILHSQPPRRPGGESASLGEPRVDTAPWVTRYWGGKSSGSLSGIF